MDRLQQPAQPSDAAVKSTRSSNRPHRYNIPDSDPNDPTTWRPSRKLVRPIAKMLVDDCDRDLLAFQWFIGGDGYARRAVRTSTGRITVHVHRLVLTRMLGRPLTQGEFPDHINGDRLDNRRENLRTVTRQQNQQNVHGNRRNKAGGLRGVSWHAKSGKWQAVVRHNRKNEYLGLFTDAKEAAAVAARRRAELGFADSQPTSMELGHGSNAAAA